MKIIHEMRHHKLLILLLVLATPIFIMVVSPEFLSWVVRNEARLALIVLIFILIVLGISVVISVFTVYVLIRLFPMHWRLRYTLFAVGLIAPLLIFNAIPPSLSFVLRTQYSGFRTALEITVVMLASFGLALLVMAASGKPLGYRDPPRGN